MPRSQTEKVSKFVDAITREANEQREEIARETKKYIEDQLAIAKDKALEDSYHLIQHRAEAVRADVGRELSRQELVSRRQLFVRRQEMENEVIGEAQKRLEAFSKSPEYPSFLEKCGKAVCDALKGDCILLIRPEDEPLRETLFKALSCKEIRMDPSIRLGGCKGERDGMAADDTLDSRLAAQRKWFELNSGLTFDE